MLRLLIALLACLIFLVSPGALATSATEMTTSRSVAILDFENANKEVTEDNWLCAGMAETLITKLRQIKDLRLVERKQILKAMEELNFTATDFFDSEKSGQLAKFLKVDVLLVGGFQHYGNAIRITARFVDVKTGEVLDAVDIKGKMDDIFDLQDQLALKLIENMGITTTSEERKTVATNPTTSLSALELYGKALNAEDTDEKIAFFTQAIEADPAYKEAYNDLAVVYMERGEWETAIGDLNKAIGVDATYFLPYYNLGICYNQLGRHNESIKAYRACIEHNANYLNAYTALVGVYITTGEYERAIEAARKAGELEPSNPQPPNAWGNALYAQGHYEEAIAKYQEVVELDPEGAYVYYNIANCYGALGKNDEALSYYGKALEVDADYALAYYRRAELYRTTLEDPTKAAIDFLTYVKLAPEDFDGYLGLARTYVALGKTKEAEEAFKAALQLKADEPNALNDLANLYYSQEDYERAEQLYLAVIKADPDYKWAYLNLGNLYAYIRNDQDTAAGYYEKVYTLDREYPRAISELSMVEVRRERWDDAISWLMKGAKLAPNEAFWSYWLGYAYDEKATEKRNEGKTRIAAQYADTAEKHLLEALKLNPQYADAYNLLGNLKLNSGAPREAIPYYEKALEADAKHVFATVNLGTANRQLTQYDEAEKWFKHAIEIAPDYAYAVYQLAAMYDNDLVQPEKALPYYRRYLELAGDDQQVKDRIKEIESGAH
jgi:superkiller protein 3